MVNGQELFIADSGNHRIQVLNMTSGNYLRQYGSLLHWPYASVTHGNDLIVCDVGKPGLIVFDVMTGSVERIVGHPSSLFSFAPVDVTINCKNELFVCDDDQHCVHVFQ